MLLLTTALTAQDPRLWGPVRPGRYGAGFTTLAVRDSSRTLATGEARPIQISLWYPARKEQAPRMTSRDYLALSASERTLQPPSEAQLDSVVAAFREAMVAKGSSAAAVDAWLATAGYAVRDAAPERGRYPIILIAHAEDGSAYHQSVIAEILASQGFLVAAAPGLLRIQPSPPAASVYDRAREQMLDLEFVRRTLAADPRANPQRVGIFAHDFGGRAAVLLANDPNVRAVISWNSAMAFARDADWLASADYSPGGSSAGVLHFYTAVEGAPAWNFVTIERMGQSDRTIIRVADMQHAHFGSLGSATGAIPGFQVGPPSVDVLRKLEWVVRLTVATLFQHVTGDASRFPSALPPFLTYRRLTPGS
jgi:hypothetical protein